MYLVDTNIFLEILLDQDKSQDCKQFLNRNYDKIFISDFPLHSIGIILFRFDKREVLKDFLQDILYSIKVVNLPLSEYEVLANDSLTFNLYFDDLCQYSIARYYNLQIVTMDTDFKKVRDIKVRFL